MAKKDKNKNKEQKEIKEAAETVETVEAIENTEAAEITQNAEDVNTTETLEPSETIEIVESKEIFVYAQTACAKENGSNCLSFHPVAFELLNSAQDLASKFPEKLKVSAIVATEDTVESCPFQSLYENGADKIYHIKSGKMTDYMGIAEGITELCKLKDPEIFLIGATVLGRSIAPLIASKLNTGLTADCTKLEITTFKDEKKLASTRPTFGGQLMATILCKNKPQMATVRPSVLLKREDVYKTEGEFEEFIPNFENYKECIKILAKEINKNKLSSELENASIIVAGGKGLKNEENFNKLRKFANLIGAALAGSRGAVDMGLIDKEHQIGQTGKTVAPKIYIAFGISGAIHHLTGINNAGKIISINNDENAPIVENSDIAIIDDASKVLDELLEELEKEH